MEITNLDLQNQINSMKTTILQTIFPAGSVYMSFVEINPEEYFGFGTWTRVKDKFLLAVGDYIETQPEAVGGDTLHQHDLDSQRDPSSTAFTKMDMGSVNILYTAIHNDYSYDTTNSYTYNTPVVENVSTRTNGVALGGFTANGSNMPPYISVYIWYRVS